MLHFIFINILHHQIIMPANITVKTKKSISRIKHIIEYIFNNHISICSAVRYHDQQKMQITSEEKIITSKIISNTLHEYTE